MGDFLSRNPLHCHGHLLQEGSNKPVINTTPLWVNPSKHTYWLVCCSCLAFAFRLWCSQTYILVCCCLVLLSLSNCDALKHTYWSALVLSCFRFQIVMLSNIHTGLLLLLSCLAFAFKLWCSETNILLACVYRPTTTTPAGAREI
jgi:hypothetical protein